MNILVVTESGSLYDIAVGLAQIGCNVTYCNHQHIDPAIVDSKDVVHVESWRPHAKLADVVLIDDPALYYRYEQSGGEAPVLYYVAGHSRGAARLVPPPVLDLLASILSGERVEAKRGWFSRIWRRT